MLVRLTELRQYPADLFLPLSFIANSKTQPNVKLVRMWQHSYIFNLSQLSIPAWNCRPVYVMTERFHNRCKSHNNFEHSDSVARASDKYITILFKVYIDTTECKETNNKDKLNIIWEV